jgi:glycosyltransferase involved in cell wall biosynthesis
VAVCVGRLAAGKGQDRLAAIWPQVRAAVPGAVLLLVGDGPLRSQIAGDGIVLAGVRSDIGDVLAASDAFVTASQGEGISLAVLEALVRGLPVVSTACAGNREVLADGAGLLVPLGDDAALATAIARVLGEPATAARLGAAARDRAHGRFRLADTISATADVYRELVPA